MVFSLSKTGDSKAQSLLAAHLRKWCAAKSDNSKGSVRMNYVIAAMVAVFAAAISYISLEKSMSDKIRLFQVADPDATYHSRTIAKREVVLLVTVLTVVAFFSALQIMIKV